MVRSEMLGFVLRSKYFSPVIGVEVVYLLQNFAHKESAHYIALFRYLTVISFNLTETTGEGANIGRAIDLTILTFQ